MVVMTSKFMKMTIWILSMSMSTRSMIGMTRLAKMDLFFPVFLLNRLNLFEPYQFSPCCISESECSVFGVNVPDCPGRVLEWEDNS